MKTRRCDFPKAVVAHPVRLAVQALFLLAVPGLVAAQTIAAPKAADNASADEMSSDVKALVCPTNYIEAGALYTSQNSPKFGEYNGLVGSPSGVYGLGNINIQGGSGFCQRGGNTRWQIYGTDLGTTSRSAGVSIQQQGKWTFSVNYDQLRHYTTTGYETPFQGSQGGNVWTLPSNFGIVSLASTTPGHGSQALTSTQLSDFYPHDVYNERQNTSVSTSYNINDNWSVKLDYNHLDMSGAKLISAASDTLSMLGTTFKGQAPVVLMNPTESTTDTLNLAVNWVGLKSYASVEYYMSLYHDEYSGVSWTSPFTTTGTTGTSLGGYALNTMSTPPSNQFQQLKVTGGYIFSPATKATGSASVAINTQDDSYSGTYTPAAVGTLPQQSLDGEVLMYHVDGRVTHQITQNLGSNIGFTYNERDNNTSSNTYQFSTLGTLAGSKFDTVINTPTSNRKLDVDAGLDYRISNNQHLDFKYQYEYINRWCGNWQANHAQGAGSATYYVDASCVQAPDSSENSGTVDYRLSLLDRVNFSAGYTYADRQSTINPAFYNPMQGESAGYEDYGYVAFFQASRRENMFKSTLNWQVTDKLSFGVDGRYTRDDYTDNTLGVKDGDSSSINLDVSYDLNSDMSFSAYASWQRYGFDMLNGKGSGTPYLPSAAASLASNWFANSLNDRDFAFGATGKQKLFHGKFTLTEDVMLDLGRTTYNTTAAPAVAATVGATGSPGDITSRLLQVRLVGAYELNKQSSVSVGYMYQRLTSNDYMYNAYMFGASPTQLLPTGQVSPNYSQNVVFVTYRYKFL